MLGISLVLVVLFAMQGIVFSLPADGEIARIQKHTPGESDRGVV